LALFIFPASPTDQWEIIDGTTMFIIASSFNVSVQKGSLQFNNSVWVIQSLHTTPQGITRLFHRFILGSRFYPIAFYIWVGLGRFDGGVKIIFKSI
jgi:hypothetical protein